MTDFISQASCGNSPKMRLIEAFHRATAHADTQSLLAMITDEFQWELIGTQSIYSKTNIESYLGTLAEDQSIKTYTLYTVLSHGRYGASEGEAELLDGNCLAFCDIFEFANASGKQIQHVKTYLVPLS
ncbi:MAG: hypothetical protein P8046_01840 [Anaerolineales bacterium]